MHRGTHTPPVDPARDKETGRDFIISISMVIVGSLSWSDMG